jgi:hypothetical protein
MTQHRMITNASLRLSGNKVTHPSFPEKEPPFFCFPPEEEIVAKVKCSLHGNRFRPTMFRIHLAKWRRESEPIRRQRLSSPYHKAWSASFP